MPGSRIVPTLAALTLAGGLAASDGVAPVLTLLNSDLQPTIPRIAADAEEPAALLDGDGLLNDLHIYNGAVPAGISPWQDIRSNSVPTRIETAGIAIIAADNRGTWQYRTAADVWTALDLADVSDADALLLSLITVDYAGHVVGNGSQLRFVPDPSDFPSGTTRVSLTFRVWDGTGRQDDGDYSLLERDVAGIRVTTANVDPARSQPHGGSPTPFSAETRTISVDVAASDDNLPPTITLIDASYITALTGVEVDLAAYFSASDPEGTSLTWSLASLDYGTAGGGASYIPGTNVGEIDSIEVIVTDLHGKTASAWISVEIVSSAPPELEESDSDTVLTVAHGGSRTFVITVSDPDDDPITYDGPTTSASHGSVAVPELSYDEEFGFTIFTFSYDHDSSNSATADAFTLRFSDVHGAHLDVPVTVAIDPPSSNAPPFIITAPSTLAVVGVPYEAVVTVRDEDVDLDLELAFAANHYGAFTEISVTPTPVITISDGISYSQRTFRVRFVPTAAGSYSASLTPNDSQVNGSTDYFTITVGDPGVASIAQPIIPLSLPGDPIYAAIAPGSTAGWSSLMTALQPHGPDIARAWWWSTPGQGFSDAEQSPVATARQPSTALFLASTIGLTFSFAAKPHPMPFAIDLPPAQAQATGPGSDGWTFFGVPALWDGTDTATTHSLNDFVLETADGIRVGNDSEVLNALAPSGDSVVQAPWGYDPSSRSYQSAAPLSTGAGYWIRNRSTTSYRLVRVATSDESGVRLGSISLEFGALPVAAMADLPPAPPAGTTNTAAKAADGSGCGAGGLAGLLLAGLACLGLRGRRRG